MAASVSAPSPTTTDASSLIDAGVSFRRDIVPIFEETCTQADDCHGSAPAEGVDLDLRAAASYESLVDRPARARRGALRVARGDPRASFVVAKLIGPLRHGEGKRMPLDPLTGSPERPNPITNDFIERVLKPWIEAGAPNN
jgi:hypothetical protein